MKRKECLTTGNVYHILNKSIAGYSIFSSERDYLRIKQMLRFFNIENKPFSRFSRFLERADHQNKSFEELLSEEIINNNRLVRIIAYCIMPTHFHLVLKQLQDDGVSKFTGDFSNSYTRYFNTKYKRKGCLWEDKFKNVSVVSDEQLLHLTRYIHLNPVTENLVGSPEEWEHSSYLEYIKPDQITYPLCDFKKLLEITPSEYSQFVNDRANYQRELAKIKKAVIE